MGDSHRSRSSSSGWTRNMGNVRSFFGNIMGGLRGVSNVASWVVAGSLAYYLWIKPSQDLKREQQERIMAAAQSASSTDSQSQAQPQETGSVQADSNSKPTNS